MKETTGARHINELKRRIIEAQNPKGGPSFYEALTATACFSKRKTQPPSHLAIDPFRV